ncbi:helix-turn-helix domain-containing protein [Paenibacillus alkaliterrae]|uniref:helix-turn-helix transcriptional regulator n=1 Tax=Paenibacillus alkaliterrae TaxID=320909 RepID=UPI001F37EA5C|nr:helix-turn-helix transcriptional regulator [Paenibacillus alkaliterrae]MCF2938948.1 helix-turn-helix domain-containing protein [Paenibacillus alkaliterrae]
MKQKRDWLSGLRNHQKLTHQDVADLAKIDRSFYTQIENGDRNPSVETAQKIANALKFDWTIFFNHKRGIKPQNKTA